jgi:hypothetical protein
MENQQFNEAEEVLTAEQLAERKEEMLQFYTESLPYLEAQHKYEKLLADIDHERFRRAQYSMQYAMMMQGPQGEQGAEPEAAPGPETPKERKLRKG